MSQPKSTAPETRCEAKRFDLPCIAEPGVVYTRTWVAELILDLAGYDPNENLVDSVAVEPACGDGRFLEPMVRRLSTSCRIQDRPLKDCATSLLAFDADGEAVGKSRERTELVLADCGWDRSESREMAWRWIREADFLLDPELDLIALGGGIDFAIGNPPYIRLESIDDRVAEVYRKRYGTMSGRADLYVGFFERALEMLAPGGVCGFICADRWMLNQYGSHLRELITRGGFSVETVVEMHRADAFQDEVLAYPAITTIRRAEVQSRVLVARMEQASEYSVNELARAAREVRQASHDAVERDTQATALDGLNYVVVDEWFDGSAPWPSASPKRLSLLKRLEAEFPPLEDGSTDTRVSIGVATGADRIFLTRDHDLVERDRLLPIVLAGDTMTGSLEWSRHYLVNPWQPDGGLVDLGHYPLLRRYFDEHKEILEGRHVAKKSPKRWYKTIDRVDYALISKPKLLIPDIKNVAHPVLDEGRYYPHHNLYYVTSGIWDLKVLGGLLLSKVGQFFIECYAVRMSGGYLRFQAQYLRRIRVPYPQDISMGQAAGLRQAFEERDIVRATAVALEVYGIDRIPE